MQKAAGRIKQSMLIIFKITDGIRDEIDNVTVLLVRAGRKQYRKGDFFDGENTTHHFESRTLLSISNLFFCCFLCSIFIFFMVNCKRRG